MSYSKTYSRINWENEPSVATPINETNLNLMDYSLDAVDTECQTLDTIKANQSDLLLCVKEITYDNTTGQFVFTWQNGSTLTVDLNIEKIPVSFSMDANGVITMTTEDGTQYTADVGSLIKTYSFVDSSQIDFTVTVDAQTGNKSVTAEIKDGSITESKLQPNFLADCKTEVTKAQNAASAAEQSEEDAEAWAVGERGGVPVGPSDPTYHNNSKYWSQQANPTTLVGLTDTDINNPQPNQVLGVDPNDPTKWVNMDAPSAGLLPHLYIDSEAGSTVTVVAPDGTIITPTAEGSGHWECDVPDYGIYTIHSVLAGQGDAVVSVTVDDVKEYHITDNHYDFTINVTAPNGSTIRITGGTETYTGTGTGSSQPFVVHTASTVYTVAVTMDGNTKSQTATSSATTGQSTSVSIEFGTITVNVDPDFITAGSTISCTKGGTSCTPKLAASTVTFRVPDTGTWIIASEISGYPYSKDAVVSNLATPVTISLETIPEGSTVTPTDDIQIWLHCAGIYDKTSYTTLDDVLADHDTLAKLISDHNAMDYLVRSKNWVSTGLVPVLNADNGKVTVSSNYSSISVPYKVFNGDWSKNLLFPSGNVWVGSGTTKQWLAYEFDSAKKIRAIRLRAACQQGSVGYLASDYLGVKSFKIQYSDDGTNWTDEGTTFTNSSYFDDTYSWGDVGAHKYWRIYVFNGANAAIGIANLQFFEESITNDEIAMRYIGKRNYASDILLNDSDWSEAIANSHYFESVLNTTVPVMTDNTHPSGECFSSGVHTTETQYQPYKAFLDNTTDDGWESNYSTAYQAGVYVPYVGYDFGSGKSVRVLKSRVNNFRHGGDHDRLVDYKIQASKDGTTYVDLCEDTYPSGVYDLIVYNTFANNDKYRYYRYIFTGNTHNWWVATKNMQFYGREDVDETNIDIYSAANDTVSITGNGLSLTCVTDTTGHGTIAKSSLPAGTYTFTSSVAKDLDNLNNYYSRSISVNGLDDVWFMPEGVYMLYWYGYKSDELEIGSVANGWQNYSGYPYVDPTFNVNSINHYAASSSGGSYNACVGNKSALQIGNGKAKIIITGKVADSSFNSALCFIYDIGKTPISSNTSVWIIGYGADNPKVPADNTMHLYTSGTIDFSGKYLMTRALYGENSDVHAIWIEPA